MAEEHSLLIVDSSESVRKAVRLAAEGLVARPVEAVSMSQAAASLAGGVDIVVTEICLPDGDGEAVLRQAKAGNDLAVVVAMTAEDDVSGAVELLHKGAFSVLSKPLSSQVTRQVLSRAVEHHAVLRQNRSAREIERRYSEDLEQRVTAQTSLITSLLEFTNELNALATVQEAVELLVGTFRRILNCERISVLLKTQETGQFAIVHSVGVPLEMTRRTLDLEDAPIVKRVVETGVLVHAADLGQDGRTDRGRGAFVSVPLSMKRDGHREVFGVINLTERGLGVPFSDHDIRLIRSVSDAASVACSNLRNRQQLERSYFDTVGALAMALEAKDRYTHGHSQRVTSMCMIVADVMGFSNLDMDQIMFAGMLHDVGKIGIPEAILCKPSQLTRKEFERIREHPVVGEGVVGHISFLATAAKIIRHHHERWDGKGYPDGLRGNAIELSSRIMAIADSYDAMTTDRSYRRKLPVHQVMDELMKGRGTQFDAECLDLFVKHVAESKSIPSFFGERTERS
ncbi:MAG: HD domain-containing protein [Deltaproteobacteria bacterium]|nr:HD domain-containing protein [Deltaproteobacteria bacterium]